MLTNIIKITTNSSWIIITIKHPLRTLAALFFTDSILPNNLNSCNMQNLYFYTLSLQILIHLLGVKKDILTSFYRFEIIISKRTSYFSLGSHNLVSECLIQWMVTISTHLWGKFIFHIHPPLKILWTLDPTFEFGVLYINSYFTFLTL